MARRQLLIVTTSPDTGSREDYNILYAGYLLVSSDTLNFDEPAFNDGQYSHNDLILELRRLGYTVEEPRQTVVETTD